MKVTDNRGKQERLVSDIKAGQCFEVYGKLHIMGDYGNVNRYSIDLRTGSVYDYNSDTPVILVDAEVITY